MSILGLAALSACLFPARRASLINPIEALRVE
jgi:ABC-type lipoprotein release transport system permease subunit